MANYWVHNEFLNMGSEKMSKSRNNVINIFVNDKALRKQVMRIETDSKALEEEKDPETCNVYALFKLIATTEESEALAARYRAGGLGYGHAKQALFEKLLEKFSKERSEYERLMNNKSEIDEHLRVGADKARLVAQQVLKRTRNKLGYWLNAWF